MPPRLSRPTEVPEDSTYLVDMLWRFYIVAGDPPMRKIARAIEKLPEDQRKGTANYETIRRTLSAKTLPQWETVEVIFLALCDIANVDPDDAEPDDDRARWEPPPLPHREELRRRYRIARYGEASPLPRTRDAKARQEAAEAKARAERARQSDPWGTAPARGSFGASIADDEPPF